jgi:hypothetical protein
MMGGAYLMPTGDHTFAPMMTEGGGVVFEGSAARMTALTFEQCGRSVRFVRAEP